MLNPEGGLSLRVSFGEVSVELSGLRSSRVQSLNFGAEVARKSLNCLNP